MVDPQTKLQEPKRRISAPNGIVSNLYPGVDFASPRSPETTSPSKSPPCKSPAKPFHSALRMWLNRKPFNQTTNSDNPIICRVNCLGQILPNRLDCFRGFGWKPHGYGLQLTESFGRLGTCDSGPRPRWRPSPGAAPGGSRSPDPKEEDRCLRHDC